MKRQNLVPLLLLICILFLSFWLRLQSADKLPSGQFLENDAYLYYWQASTISSQGDLPDRDMDRWLPLGRDNGLLLSLYSYVLAYTYKAVNLFFKDVSLYHVCIYLPTLSFVFGLAILCVFLYSRFNGFVANTTGLLIATLPGTIGRSTVGFGDRDSWCLLLAIGVLITYLLALQSPTFRKRFAWTLVSGILTLLGGLSWEGFGVFLLVIYAIELWRFLSSDKDADLLYYVIWICCFVPLLFVVSPAYYRGVFFATHVAALMLVPPLVILALRVGRHLLLRFTLAPAVFRDHPRYFSLGLTLLAGAAVIIYLFTQLDTLAGTTFFMETPLMTTISELNNPYFSFWTGRYGSVFIIACILLVAGSYRRNLLILTQPLMIFVLVTFGRQPVAVLFGEWFCGLLFGVSVCACLLMFLYAALRHGSEQQDSDQPVLRVEYVHLMFAVWFFLWVGLSRDAMRYDFFIGIPIAFFCAVAIQQVSEFVETFFEHTQAGKIAAVSLLALILFWAPVGGHARFSVYAATQMRTATPGHNTPVAVTFAWMKEHLKDAVVAAHWRFGSQLNVLAGVKTITDQDHYIPNWVHLYNKYVHYPQTDSEILGYLKTHEATHILITTSDDPSNALLNRNPLGYKHFKPVFPTTNFARSPIKLWQIMYPQHIATDPKYLATEQVSNENNTTSSHDPTHPPHENENH